MRFHLPKCLLLGAAACSSLSSAYLEFDPIPSTVEVGEVYQVNFTIDHNYTTECLLICESKAGWDEVSTLFDGKQFPKGANSFQWTVERPPFRKGLGHHNYGIWMLGRETLDPSLGYANSSNWFKIHQEFNDRNMIPVPLAHVCVGAVSAIAIVYAIVKGSMFFVKRRQAELKGRNMATLDVHEKAHPGTNLDEKFGHEKYPDEKAALIE